ncbi:chaperone modulator CbpM [Marinobacteraceae bacterium S3BR75-40.1]
MPSRTTLHLEILDDEVRLSLAELCRNCDVHAEYVIELVEYGVLHPRGHEPRSWEFAGRDLMRIKKALRLRRDLDINLPGLALSMELLDEIDELRRALRHMEQRLWSDD